MSDGGDAAVPATVASPPPRSRTGFRAEFRDFLTFVRRPSTGPRLPRKAGRADDYEWFAGIRLRRLLCWVSLLWVVNLMVLGPLAAYAASAIGAERRVPGMVPWLLALVWAPIFEEMIFRYPLRRPAVALWLPPLAYLCVSVYQNAMQLVRLTAGALGLGIWLYDTRRNGWTRARTRRFHRYFPLVFHVFTLAFALLHLNNFNLGGKGYWLLPLLILPQWVTGLVLGWMRVRFGIGASIMLHALFNAGPVTLLWAIHRWAPAFLAG